MMNRKIILIFFLFLPFLSTLDAQKAGKKFSVSGHITDPAGKPIQDALILIDGKKTSTTDSRGFYRVRVKPGSRMIAVFKNVNGLSEEMIDGRTTIDISLGSGIPLPTGDMSDKSAGETVNIGYGNISKNELTGSVGSINGRNNKFASYSNIYDMIKGEVPGVQVNGNRIIIQGVSSINSGTDPLFVIDGTVVSTIDDVMPQFVKSISILKGSAASIYGSRGANGVILITLLGAEKKQ